MLIALDFDGTFTEDPSFWLAFITLVQKRGHEVICATMRHEQEGAQVQESLGHLVDIHYTGRKAKKPFLLRKGIRPDIWIDDQPHFINVAAL